MGLSHILFSVAAFTYTTFDGLEAAELSLLRTRTHFTVKNGDAKENP